MQNVPTRLTRSEASEYLRQHHGISRAPATLAKLAVKGGGPAYRKAGTRLVIYEVTELDRWAEEILSPPMGSTSKASSNAAE